MTKATTPLSPPKRIVTGHNADGKSVFLSTGPAPQHHNRQQGLVQFHELWHTGEMPVPLDLIEALEPNECPLRLPPEANGSVIRILDIHPGHVQAWVPRTDGRHPGMHRTQTLDYGILIQGEIHMILDDKAEVCLHPGDVVIQRGTDHAWENRSNEVARIAFILLDGKFTGELAERMKGIDLQHGPLSQRAEEKK
jgi:Cupin domain